MPLAIKQPLSLNIEAKKLCNCCISIKYLMKIFTSWKLPDRTLQTLSPVAYIN